MDGETGALLEYIHLSKQSKYKEMCKHSYGNKRGRLAQGVLGRVQETKTILFIKKAEVPQNRHRDVTYVCVCYL